MDLLQLSKTGCLGTGHAHDDSVDPSVIRLTDRRAGIGISCQAGSHVGGPLSDVPEPAVTGESSAER